jgi:biotin transport system permease protein
MLGRYRPGTSVLHRAPAGLKLLLLTVILVPVALRPDAPVVAVAVVVLLIGTAVARVPLRVLGSQLRPVVPLVALAAGLQGLGGSWPAAAALAASLLTGVWAAALVTVTTTTTELLDVVTTVVGPARHLGVDPERVGLVLALTIRTIPVLTRLVEEVRQAQAARGTRSLRAFAVPTLVRTVRHADRMAEALAARGLDD